jgi:predicted pyridoxine 5'-phosphate oxidase superfamily flavin-nucleotide-binding protein
MPRRTPYYEEGYMSEITKDIVEVVNKRGRVGALGTADKNGQPNVAYFGSPRLSEDGTLIMGLGNNRSLKNLEENPLAAFFCVAESPVTFKTPGYRLYLKVREIQREGALFEGVRDAIGKAAGADAAKMIVAAVSFEVTGVRPLVAWG